MGLTFRKINADDFPLCADILVSAYKGAPWYNAWTKEEAQLRIEATMSGFNARGYVAEKNNKIIAMCLGRIDYYYDNWSQFCVDEFNVDASMKGQGIGKQLLEFTSENLKRDGVNRLFLITGGTEASVFYEKNGFVKTDEGIMMEFGLQD